MAESSQPQVDVTADGADDALETDVSVDQAAIDALFAAQSEGTPDAAGRAASAATPADAAVPAAATPPDIDQDAIDALLADATQPDPAGPTADPDVAAATHEVLAAGGGDSDVDDAVTDVDQAEIDRLVSEAAAAEAGGGAPEPGGEPAVSVAAPAHDAAAIPVPADAPVGEQIAALLDAGAASDSSSGRRDEPGSDDGATAYALMPEAERGKPEPEVEPAADGATAAVPVIGDVDEPAAAAVVRPAGRTWHGVSVRTLGLAAVGGFVMVLALAMLVTRGGGGELAVAAAAAAPTPSETKALPTPAPPPPRAPNAASFTPQAVPADAAMTVAMGRWPLATVEVREETPPPAAFPTFVFNDPIGDGIDPETGAARRPHLTEADIAVVQVDVTGTDGGVLDAGAVNPRGFALAGGEVRVWVDMAGPVNPAAGTRYQVDLVGRFRNAAPEMLATTPSGALVPGSQLAVTLRWIDGAWSSRMEVWQPTLGTAVPFGNFAGFRVVQQRIEFRLPVALLQPFMAAEDRADSFDFFIRVTELAGSRGVVDFAAHGQALETPNSALIDLSAALLTDGPEVAARPWEAVDPVRARLVARQALSLMELPSSLFRLSVALAR